MLMSTFYNAINQVDSIFSLKVIILQKNHTHLRKVGHTSKSPFGIYWWTLKNPKKQTFEKMKKIAGDIIILHMCNINHNRMKNSSWDTEWDRIFCQFGPFFALLIPSPLKTQKINILKKWKKHLEIIILNLYNKKHDHMMYAYSDIECDRHNFFVVSGHFSLFFPTIDPEN